MLPGESQKVAKIESCIGKEGTIELPVLHEHSDIAAAAATAGPPSTKAGGGDTSTVPVSHDKMLIGLQNDPETRRNIFLS